MLLRNKNSVYQILIIAAWSVLTISAAFNTAQAGTEIIHLKTPDLQITGAADGPASVKIEGYTDDPDPGNPCLPYRFITVLLPPEADMKTVRVEPGEIKAAAVPGDFYIDPARPEIIGAGEYWGEGKEIVQGRNMKVYGKNAFYPPAFYRISPPSRKRIWKYLRIKYSPIRYNPVTGSLLRAESLTIRVIWDDDANDEVRYLSDDPVAAAYAPEAENLNQAGTWYGSDDDDGLSFESLIGKYTDLLNGWTAPANYIIITTNEIESASTKLEDFKIHKRNMGYTVRVITEDEYGAITGQAPDGTAEKIRQWLIDNYTPLGIEYVLLIGDPDPDDNESDDDRVGDIPMKMCWPMVSSSHREAPGDYFYADLTGDWDADGDGYFGTWNDYRAAGGVDFAAEVFVGRIPVYQDDPARIVRLDRILEKTIRYETGRYTAWRRSALLPMSFLTTSYDGAELGEAMDHDYLSGKGYETHTFYQQGSGICGFDSDYASDEELMAGSAVRASWTEGAWGLVCWNAHGSETAAYVGDGGSCSDGKFITSADTALLNDNYPSFVFQCSCQNGCPEQSGNLQYALLTSGGVATVAATRDASFYYSYDYASYPEMSPGIAYGYCDRLTDNEACGRALYEHTGNIPLTSLGSGYANLMIFNLYGDPSLSLSPTALPENWEIQKSGTAAHLHDVEFIDTSTGWAAGDDGIHVTGDGGEEWELQWTGEWTGEPTGEDISGFSNITMDEDGNFTIAGRYYNGLDYDLYLEKHDSAGSLLWSELTDSGERDGGGIIASTEDGGTVMWGRLSGEMGLISYDPDGNFLWQRNYDYEEGLADIAIGPDGSIYGAAWGSTGITLWKYDSEGRVVAGIEESDYPAEQVKMDVDDEGNPYLFFPMEVEPKNMVVQKYDSDLDDLLWEIEFEPGGNGTSRDISLDGDGNIYCSTGETLVKFDAEGNEQWMINAAETLILDDFKHIAALPDGDIIIAGELSDMLVLLRCSTEDGAVIWQQTYDWADTCAAIAVYPDCRVVLSGLREGEYVFAIVPVSGVTGLSMVDSSRGWAAGPGKILHTSDGGATWEAEYTDIDFSKVQFLSSSIGFLLGNNELRGTADGGASWEILLSDEDAVFTGLSFYDRDHGWVAGEGGRLYYTADGGVSWSETTVEGEIDLHAITARSESSAYASGADGYLVYVVNGIYSFPYRAGSGAIRDLTFLDAGPGWFCGYSIWKNDPDEYTYREIDLSEIGITTGSTTPAPTWLKELTLTDTLDAAGDQHFNALSFPGPLRGWAVGDYGMIWHYSAPFSPELSTSGGFTFSR